MRRIVLFHLSAYTYVHRIGLRRDVRESTPKRTGNDDFRGPLHLQIPDEVDT